MWEEALVSSLASAKVAICGDAMIDHYVMGAVSRISPEAPVPVLHVASERHVLGGAGNVAANIVALGGHARLIGVIGEDFAGQQMLQMLKDAGTIDARLGKIAGGVTIAKTRYLGGQQQLVRVDREAPGALGSVAIDRIKAELDEALLAFDVFVLSDYGKGVLGDEVLGWFLPKAQAAGKFVIVDPKRKRLEDYRGASLISPNRKELEEAVGLPCGSDEEAEAAADEAIARSGAAILLTRSERGMSLYRKDQAPVHFAAEAREVFDVSGAGDTVVAALAAGLAAGRPVEQALRAANAAAGVVVGKLGTATCSPEELLVALKHGAERETDPFPEGAGAEGVTPLKAMVAERVAWREQGLVVGFANGCFDLLHPGHVTLLRKAASHCDRLIVAINSDASVSRLKGPARPVQTQDNRAIVLNGIKGVDAVIVFEQDTPLEVIEALTPDLLFKGSDYTEDGVVGGDVVKAAGGKVVLIDLVEGHSTTALVKRSSGQP